MKQTEILRNKIFSSNIEESIEGIEESISLINETADSIVNAFEISNEPFIIAERMSLLFDGYLKKIRKHLVNDNFAVKFYSASLIVHYEIKDVIAENILIETIHSGLFDYASVATTILCRVKSIEVKNAILFRLTNDNLMSDVQKFFFTEKLKDC